MKINEDVEIIKGDCLVEMLNIPDKSIDMILCDLPYAITQNKWDILIPFEPLWKQYNRVIKENGAIVLTASQPFTSQLIMSNLSMFKYEMIWEKPQGTGHLNAKKMPLKSHENICIFYKHLPVYNPQMIGDEVRTIKRNGEQSKSNNYGSFVNLKESTYIGKYPKTVLKYNSDKRNNSTHPTAKPVSLLEYLIKTYTNEGNIILDNTMGSGSTGIAAINTDRKFIGIEMNEDYFNISVDRINKRIKEIEDNESI